ncbi:hypothetical protein BDB00DRAFT_872364 [Zychaea mexicana]|uniref:uncharacterized protein n=1 Tax=Zychaea mexicana TaxID=64656 RepID=UPI0022FEE86C|nr:uncharacterized protein BDB00DRAFT_872364 [Zychaea mexicana]KAI9493479.1 hypothetical protein BDB00DRAFT_872364 [Zychaea mexicana]
MKNLQKNNNPLENSLNRKSKINKRVAKKPNSRSEESVGKIKKRIRDLKRTLQKGASSAKAKVESERKLRASEYELGERYIDEQEEKHYQKYRTAKFLESKKAERKVKQASKKLEAAENDEQREEWKAKLEEHKIDVLYVKHFPCLLPYISLYEKEKSDTEKNEKIRQEVRQKIKAILDKNGDLDEMAREYRAQYREKMIQIERIPAVRPLNDQEETPKDFTRATKKEASLSASEAPASSSEAIAAKDDFFEF